tara:strand:+ start:1901 stop:2107 length:207 start_codon:yes stop_codon:yes gene_type:complete
MRGIAPLLFNNTELQMSKSEKLKAPIKKETIKHIALKALCTIKGMVRVGEEFSCTEKELVIFKKHKAV